MHCMSTRQKRAQAAPRLKVGEQWDSAMLGEGLLAGDEALCECLGASGTRMHACTLHLLGLLNL
jgi:hypothetical protein